MCRLMGNELKAIVERYCPVVGRNVAVEVSGRDENACCLNMHNCSEERGGCENRIFNGGKK